MDVIILCAGTWGDVLPYVYLQQMLTKRGMASVLLTNPLFQDRLDALQANYHLVGQAKSLQQAIEYMTGEGMVWEKKSAAKPNLTKMIQALKDTFFNGIDAMVDYVEAHKPHQPVLIQNYICYGGRYIQIKTGLKAITTCLSPFYVRSKYQANSQPGIPEYLPDWLKRGVRYFFEESLLMKRVFQSASRHYPFERYWRYPDRFSPDGVAILCSSILAKQQADWPARTRLLGFPYNPQPTTVTSGKASAIEGDYFVFNPGSWAVDKADFWLETAKVCRTKHLKAVFIGVEQQPLTPEDAEWIQFVGYVPLAELFKQAAFVVHAGGNGTAGEVFKAGKPHIIVPSLPEQFDYAKRIEDLGVGIRLTQSDFNAARLEAAIDQLMDDPAVALRCHKYKTIVNQEQAIESLCDWISQLRS